MKKPKKRHAFKVKITMSQSIGDKVITQEMPYRLSNDNTDDLTISDSYIIIEGDRVKEVDFKEVFSNYKSELYSQIIKSMIYYFCAGGFVCEIDSIELYDKTGILKDRYDKSEINQISSLFITSPLLFKIDLEKLKVIFEANGKGNSYYYALTYILRSLCLNNAYDSFEKLWKAFNSIYKEVAKLDTEFDCQAEIRKIMVSHPEQFPEINSLVNNLTATQIRDKVRWVAMLKNDYGTDEKTPAFKEFIKRNKDFRLMTICKETLGFREKYLKAAGLYDEVEQHIDRHITLGTVNNMHVAATLCIKYMYFVRNKFTHAEHADGGFRLISDNKEHVSVNWCSGLLSALLVDLINCN